MSKTISKSSLLEWNWIQFLVKMEIIHLKLEHINQLSWFQQKVTFFLLSWKDFILGVSWKYPKLCYVKKTNSSPLIFNLWNVASSHSAFSSSSFLRLKDFLILVTSTRNSCCYMSYYAQNAFFSLHSVVKSEHVLW